MQIYWTTLVDVIDEATDTKTFYLDLPEGFTWEEGAHTHLVLEGFNSEEKPDKGLVWYVNTKLYNFYKVFSCQSRSFIFKF